MSAAVLALLALIGLVGGIGVAAVGPGEMRPIPPCVLVGPTCHATRFATGTVRSWGIGLLPLGWSKFVGTSAEAFADRFVDAEGERALDGLTALRAPLRDADGDPAAQAAAIATGTSTFDQAQAWRPPVVATAQPRPEFRDAFRLEQRRSLIAAMKQG